MMRIINVELSSTFFCMNVGLSPRPSSPLGCEHKTYKRALELRYVFEKGGEGAINSLMHEEEQFTVYILNNIKFSESK